MITVVNLTTGKARVKKLGRNKITLITPTRNVADVALPFTRASSERIPRTRRTNGTVRRIGIRLDAIG